METVRHNMCRFQDFVRLLAVHGRFALKVSSEPENQAGVTVWENFQKSTCDNFRTFSRTTDLQPILDRNYQFHSNRRLGERLDLANGFDDMFIKHVVAGTGPDPDIFRITALYHAEHDHDRTLPSVQLRPGRVDDVFLDDFPDVFEMLFAIAAAKLLRTATSTPSAITSSTATIVISDSSGDRGAFTTPVIPTSFE